MNILATELFIMSICVLKNTDNSEISADAANIEDIDEAVKNICDC